MLTEWEIFGSSQGTKIANLTFDRTWGGINTWVLTDWEVLDNTTML
jgi:hypothetical protein